MQDTHHIAFFIPMAVGIGAVLCTIFIHALPLSATINFIRREEKVGHVGVGLWTDTIIVARVILYALAAHLVEIALWAVAPSGMEVVLASEVPPRPTADSR